MSYFNELYSRTFQAVCSRHLVKVVCLSLFSVLLYPQLSLADSATQPKQTLTGGTVISGKITKGNFLPSEPSNGTPILLSSGSLVGGNITSGFVEMGDISVNPASGVSVTNATISNANIINTSVTYKNNEGKSKTEVGALSDVQLAEVKINKATLVYEKESAAGNDNPATLSDEHSWSGDVLVFHADFPNFTDASGGAHCAPNQSRFEISNEDKGTHQLRGVFNSVGDDNSRHKRIICDQGNPINIDTVYFADKARIEPFPHSRRGWAFGALIIPFKYQLSDKSFSGATSVGPYLGYRVANFGQLMNGTSTTWVVSAGWTPSIIVQTAAGVTPAGSVNRSGVSIATGFIFSIDKGTGTQVGVLFGQDRLGSNATTTYAYEGKTWLSVAIGFKFL